MQAADLNRAIERTLTVSPQRVEVRSPVETDLQPLPDVTCMVSAVNQVLLNLICNAAHAIEDKAKGGAPASEKGTIKVRHPDRRQRRHHRGERTPALAFPRTSETGFSSPSSPPRTWAEAVSRPAISRSIVVEKHHGTIDFESKVGVGTTFFVRLPVSPEAQERDG